MDGTFVFVTKHFGYDLAKKLEFLSTLVIVSDVCKYCKKYYILLFNMFKGSVFVMESEAAKKICDEDSKLDVKITIRNLKKEAMDDNESSGVSDGSD